jgi:hypothetical protein
MEAEMLNSQGIDRDEVKTYLDDLRDSGETNMFGAAAYLQRDYGFSKNEARAELTRWMSEFGK